MFLSSTQTLSSFFMSISLITALSISTLSQETTKPAISTSQPSSSDEQQDLIRVGMNEVLLDLIVRDRRGKPISDLKPDEIEVFEDGVKQKVTSFNLVEGQSSARVAQESGVVSRLDSLPHINLVSLVFDTLAIEARKQTQKAALDFLANELRPNLFVAVFTIEPRLHVLQEFTNDRNSLRRAIELATNGNSTQFSSHSEAIREQLDKIKKQQTGTNEKKSVVDSGATPDVGHLIELKRAEIVLDALRFADQLPREQPGRSSLSSLLSLIRGEQQLVGRKALLYFSEGLQVPSNLTELFRTTISEANRANVSIYSVDARGLMTSNQLNAQRDMLEHAAFASQPQQVKSSSEAVTRAEVGAAEMTEYSLRLNTQGILNDLSQSTGGFIIANTNDTRSSMQRVISDMNSFYQLAYTPQSNNDGKFRRITVKISRPNVAVQSRNGYFAPPPSNVAPPVSSEEPMLAALTATQLPHAFELRSGTWHFEQTTDGIRHHLVIEIPLANYPLRSDQEKNTYRANFSIIAVLKDADHHVVQKFKQDFPLEGPTEKMATLKNTDVVMARSFWLPPGRYTLETVAMDRETGKISAERSTLVALSPTETELRMSSIAVVKRLDTLTAEEAKSNDDSLRYQGSKLVPFIGEPTLQGKGSGLPLYLAIYPSGKISQPAQLSLELRQNEKLIASATPALPPADQQGRIPFVLTIPTDSFKSAHYKLKVRVEQGQAKAEEEIAFVVNAPEISETATEESGVDKTSASHLENDHHSEALSTSETTVPPAVSSKDIIGPRIEMAPDVAELVRESDLNGIEMHKKVLDYTYLLKKTRRTLNSQGKVTKESVQDFEAYPVLGQHVLIQLSNNGVAFSESKIASDRRRAGQELEKEEENIRKLGQSGSSPTDKFDRQMGAGIRNITSKSSTAVSIDLSEFLRSCKFSAEGHERSRNREAIVLSFSNCGNQNLPNNKAYMTKLVGKIWIDTIDKVVMRLEGWPDPVLVSNKVAKEVTPRHEPALIYQQTRLPTGVWFPNLIRMNAGGDALLFNGLNWDVQFELRDYKRFDTTVGDIKISTAK